MKITSRSLFILALFFGLNSFVLAASHSNLIDSLNQNLIGTTGELRVILLIDLSYELNISDLPRSTALIEEALALSKTLEFQKGEGSAYYAMGYLYHLQEDFIKAEKYYYQALPIFEAIKNEKKISEVYSRLGHIYALRAEYERSLETYSKALEISKKNKDSLNIGIISFSMANSYSYLGEREKAFHLLETSKPYIEFRPHLIHYYGVIGDLYRGTGDNEKSLEAFFKAVEICKEFSDTLRMAYIFEAIGETHSDMGNYAEGTAYYFKVIELNKKLDLPNLSTVSFLGLGKLHGRWGDHEEALKYFNKALTLAKTNQLNEVIPACYQGMGNCYVALEKNAEALSHFELALSEAEKWKLKEDIIDSRISLGKVYLELGQFAKALNILSSTIAIIPDEWNKECKFSSLYATMGSAYIEQNQFGKGIVFLKQGLGFAENCSNKVELQSYLEKLAQAYKNAGNYQMALKYQQQFANLKMSALAEDNSKKMMALRTKFETEEKEKEIILLQKEGELQTLNLVNNKAELSRKENFLMLMGLLILVGGLLAYLFFNRFKLKKKTEQLKYENRQIALEQEHFKISQQLKMAEWRSNFFTDISHEIRTPLSLILSPVKELLRTAPENSKVQSNYLLIQRNAERLLELMDQTLDLSKLESGQLPLQLKPIHSSDLLNNVSQKFHPLFKEKKLRFEFRDKTNNPIMHWDVDKMEKVISNLLINAIEYTLDGGAITLILEQEFSTTQNEDDDRNAVVLIKVQDNGKGIPKQQLEVIFERYARLDNQHNVKGAGIGLALSKKIVELHHGEISVESETGVGSTFCIRLPLEKQTQKIIPYALSSPERHPVSNQSKEAALLVMEPAKTGAIEILLVEDHIDLRNYLLEKLEQEGYQVTAAEDGQSALNYLKNRQPELIISDVMMPKVNGLELLSHLKTNTSTSHIPVVLLTAKATPEDKLEGLEMGADDYITKPFQLDELLIRSKNLIEQRRKFRAEFLKHSKIVEKQNTIGKKDKDFLQRAIKLVEQRINDGSYSVEKLCQELWMSRSNVYNKIKSLTGENIAGFIRKIRLKAAAEMIENGQSSMSEIGLNVGFNNRQSFNKAFKNHFGVTPTEFRKGKRREVAGEV